MKRDEIEKAIRLYAEEYTPSITDGESLLAVFEVPAVGRSVKRYAHSMARVIAKNNLKSGITDIWQDVALAIRMRTGSDHITPGDFYTTHADGRVAADILVDRCISDIPAVKRMYVGTNEYSVVTEWSDDGSYDTWQAGGLNDYYIFKVSWQTDDVTVYESSCHNLNDFLKDALVGKVG